MDWNLAKSILFLVVVALSVYAYRSLWGDQWNAGMADDMAHREMNEAFDRVLYGPHEEEETAEGDDALVIVDGEWEVLDDGD